MRDSLAFRWFRALIFDPVDLFRRWRALPVYVKNLFAYRRGHSSGHFHLYIRNTYFRTHDRFASAGSLKGHYALQDYWAARRIYDMSAESLVDIGSRLDGFITHVLPFCSVSYVDIRPLNSPFETLTFIRGSMNCLPFDDCSVELLSSLHVIEHVGLGRYGDPIDPDGHIQASKELRRVLKPGGKLLLSTPVGRERLCFDAHRVFNPMTLLSLFKDLDLHEFSYIDDDGEAITTNGSLEDAAQCQYGCGLFLFGKP